MIYAQMRSRRVGALQAGAIFFCISLFLKDSVPYRCTYAYAMKTPCTRYAHGGRLLVLLCSFLLLLLFRASLTHACACAQRPADGVGYRPMRAGRRLSRPLLQNSSSRELFTLKIHRIHNRVSGSDDGHAFLAVAAVVLVGLRQLADDVDRMVIGGLDDAGSVVVRDGGYQAADLLVGALGQLVSGRADRVGNRAMHTSHGASGAARWPRVVGVFGGIVVAR